MVRDIVDTKCPVCDCPKMFYNAYGILQCLSPKCDYKERKIKVLISRGTWLRLYRFKYCTPEEVYRYSMFFSNRFDVHPSMLIYPKDKIDDLTFTDIELDPEEFSKGNYVWIEKEMK